MAKVCVSGVRGMYCVHSALGDHIHNRLTTCLFLKDCLTIPELSSAGVFGDTMLFRYA